MSQPLLDQDLVGAPPDLVDWLAKSGIQPIDALHVCAMLEMNGWTDRRAMNLGYDSVFTLGEVLFAALRARLHRELAIPRKKVHWLASVWHTLMLYLRGLAFAMPMLVASASVLTIRYSFMSYIGFSTEVATGIALGTFASFMVAGGFTQAVARRGLFYLSQGLYSLARRSSTQLLIIGLLMTAVVGVAVGLLILVVPVLPWSMVRVTFLYYSLLTVIWLGVGLLYMLQGEQIILLLITASIAVVYVEVEYFQMEMMTSQAYAMAALGIGSVLAGYLMVRRLERREESDGSARSIMPRWSQVARSLAPYFLYGTLYFGLLFTDRLMAWSVPAEFHPYVIWFLGDYELGMDWALWTLVLPMGLVEVYIHVMFHRISHRQQVTPISQIEPFNRRFAREHLTFSIGILAAAMISIGLLVSLMHLLVSLEVLPFFPLDQPVTRFVYYVAAPAYGLTTVGLQNALVLFSLNVPWPIVRVVGISLVVDLVIGFLFSRYGGHQWAVVGFAAGAIAFAVLSSIEARKVMLHLDVHLMRSV